MPPVAVAHGQGVGNDNRARRRAEGGLQHHGAVQVAASHLGGARGPDRPVAGLVTEEATEDRRAVEAGEAQPVDRSVPAHQRRAVPIRKQRIVGYRGRAHVSSSTVIRRERHDGQALSPLAAGAQRRSWPTDDMHLPSDSRHFQPCIWQVMMPSSMVPKRDRSALRCGQRFCISHPSYGDKARNLTGVAQGISNIEAATTWKVYQFWLEQNLFGDNRSLLFGIYDLNSQFDCRDASSIFINPSQAIGPDFSQTGRNGPSIFPSTSLALRVKYNILNNFTLHSAVFDGVPGNPQNPYGTYVILNKNEGLLITNELDYQSSSSAEPGFLKIAAGSWLFTSKFEDLTDMDYFGNSLKRNDNLGFYLFEEQKIIPGAGSPADEISYYLRTGIANGNVNQFNSYYGGGITFKGLYGKRRYFRTGIFNCA